MGKVLYFDCFSGISGDMSLGALIDLGLDEKAVRKELDKLKVSGYELKVNKVSKMGIMGTDVDVVMKEDRENPETARNLKDIETIITQSELQQDVKTLAIQIFRELAAAEAKVHGKTVEQVHFHEVGAIDSIVDTVGVALCICMIKKEFGVEKILCSPITEGSGFVHCSHGTIPVPVPAVLEMLKGSNLILSIGDSKGELVTPTGLSIVKTCAKPWNAQYGQGLPGLSIERVGYGFGKRNTGKLNGLRVILGDLKEGSALGAFEDFGEMRVPGAKGKDEVVLLEANIDNSSPEILGYTMSQLFENGALDVFFTPIQMKKNRPAVMLSAMVLPEQSEELSEIIFRETGTIGIRRKRVERILLRRKIKKINTKYGEINVKFSASEGNDIKKYEPEYEDCIAIAKKTGVALREIYKEVDRVIKL